MIPCTGTIKASDINTELGRSPSYNFRIGDPEERQLAGKPSGLIKFSDFYCKSMSFNMLIGSYSYDIFYDYNGFSSSTNKIMGRYGNVNGTNPGPLFPAGYGGADRPFYVNQIATIYGNASGRDIRLVFTQQSNFSDYSQGVAVFGSRVKLTIEFPGGVTYNSTIPWGGGYYGMGDNGLYALFSRYNNQNCKVTLNKG